MPSLVPELLAAGQQLAVVEESRGVLDDGIVGPVVLTQQDLAGVLAGVEVVQTLQEGYV